MKRRQFLGTVAAPSFSSLIKENTPIDLINQGKVVRKAVVGVASDTREELAVATPAGTATATTHESLVDDDGPHLDKTTDRNLRKQYVTVDYYLTVDHYDESFSRPETGSTVAYRTNRTLFNGLEVGDNISFQTSLLRPRTLISISCLAADRKSLQAQCDVSSIDTSTTER
jgi:hypothetical protein